LHRCDTTKAFHETDIGRQIFFSSGCCSITALFWTKQFDISCGLNAGILTLDNYLKQLSLVEPGLYSVMIQLKIVFIALFSTLILKRKYSSRQWISFLLLAIGCSVSQVSMDSVIRDRPQVEQVGLSGDDDRI